MLVDLLIPVLLYDLFIFLLLKSAEVISQQMSKAYLRAGISANVQL